jgi:Cu/Ag efflux protein CusF
MVLDMARKTAPGFTSWAALCLAASMFAPASADAESRAGSGAAYSGTRAKEMYADGTVRRIDRATGQVTLRHGPVTNLGIPAMTMIYRVREPAMLDALSVGDLVRFQADRVSGVFVITNLQRQWFVEAYAPAP